jgi:hypothetical protein
MDSTNDNRKHRSVLVQVGPWSDEIDVGIAPLIRELWIAGIETHMSCEEDGYGKVWIDFPHVSNLVRFLNIVAQYEAGADGLYNRMNDHLPSTQTELTWDYELHPSDSSLIYPAADKERGENFQHEGQPDFYFTFTVRFPPGDLAIVTSRMQAYNRNTWEQALNADVDSPATTPPVAESEK